MLFFGIKYNLIYIYVGKIMNNIWNCQIILNIF